MTQIRTLLHRAALAAFFVASSAPALAQSFTGVAPGGRVFANPGASAAPGSWVTATAWFDRAFCTTNNMVPVRQGGTWSCASIGAVIQAWDADLDALAALSGTGIAARTAANTWATRTLQQPAAGLTITNPGGVAGDPTFALANDLAALEGLSGTGFAVRTGADTWAQRSLANATAGITWTNGNGVAGNPTPVLANDLAAVESLSGTGCTARTATDTWNTRAITGTANEITVTNGDCVAGNPTLSLPSALTFTGKTVTGGTFASPTVQNLLSWTNAVTATQLTANQNNYTASDGTSSCADRGVLRISSDATRSVTGLSCGQADGAIKSLVNVGSFDIVLANEDAGSIAANRLAIGSNTTLTPSSAIALRYDATSSRWRPVAGSGSGGGGGSGTVTSVAISSTDLSVSGSPISTSGTITLNVANDAITNAKLANMAASTIKCRVTASTGDPEDCNGTQALSILPNMTGATSGSPGVRGIAPAPAAGDNVKFLRGDATFAHPGLVRLHTVSASGASEIDLVTGLNDATGDAFEIRCSNLKPSVDDTALWMRVATAGPTWQSGSSAYEWNGFVVVVGSTGALGSASDSKMVLAASGLNPGSGAGENVWAAIRFNNPEANDFVEFGWDTVYSDSNSASRRIMGSGKYKTAGPIAGVRLLFATGTISGSCSLYAFSKS